MIITSTYGRLTADPQLADNRCTFTVAADSSHVDPETHRPTPEFFRVTIWGKRAEIAATYLHKGDAVFVSGDFYSDDYVGRDNKTYHSQYLNNASWAFGEKKRQNGDDDELLPD